MGSICVPNVPWVICGDFNAILAQEDKASGDPNWEGIRNATSLLQDLGFHEPSSMGRRFTWMNGHANPI